MSKVYKQGIVSPKGFDLSAAEPVDQRTIVQYKVDLLSDISLPNVYPGLKVQVLEQIDNETLREYKYVGGDRTLTANWVEVTGGAGSVDPGTLPLKFTSFVFIRNIGQPDTPTGGSYEDPIPVGWYDTVPAGTDPIWMSSAVFTQGDATPSVWAEPILTEDTATTEFEYCKTIDVTEWNGDSPAPPLESDLQRVFWHDDPAVEDDWMAIGYKNGGEYPLVWDIVRIGGEQGAVGDPGAPGKAYKQSIVFTRSNDNTVANSVVTGGGFSSPYPTETKVNGVPIAVTWYDGIPAGTAKVWMTSFVFNDEDHFNPSTSNIWATPSATTDTAIQDFEFSHQTSLPQNPDIDPGAWHDIADSNDIWMATRNIANGIIGSWGITKIKGEAGEQGQGLNISGRDTIANILAKPIPGTLTLYEIWLASNTDSGGLVPGVVNDAYLYVGAGLGTGGTAWDNIGGITGTDASSYLQSTVFQRSAAQPATPTGGSFGAPVPAGWSDGIPAAVLPVEPVWRSHRFFASDSGINAGLDDWSAPVLAGDTVDYDFEYAAQQPGDATPLPPDQAAGGIWHNDPLETDYWMAKGQKINEVLDPDTWQVIRIKGEKGDTGLDGVPSFLSSAYLKTNIDISGVSVTGGTYVNPIPTSLADGKSWSDGIPAGDGAIWFVQTRFEQGDDGSPTKVWPSPVITTDSSTVEYHYSSNPTVPAGDPLEGSDGSNTWWDDASSVTGTIRWMAIGAVRNGVWPTSWDKVQVIGETGADGLTPRTYIGSSMFTRCDNDAINQITATGGFITETVSGNGDWFIDVTGGVTTSSTVGGITYIYRDGIPERTESGNDSAIKVWMIQKVFNTVDHITGPAIWAAPTLLADNTNTDYQYHTGLNADHLGKPNDPSGIGSNPDDQGWYDTPNLNGVDETWWIAQKNWSDGVGAAWQVYRIRGADGTDVIETAQPTVPTNLKVYREGYGNRVSWGQSVSDPAATIDYYEVEETAQNFGLFSSTTLSLLLTGLDGVNKPEYTFRVRAVDTAGTKSDWSLEYDYTPPSDNLYGFTEGVDPECQTVVSPAFPTIYILGNAGRDLDGNEVYGFSDPERVTPYPSGDITIYGFVNGSSTRSVRQIKIIGAGVMLDLGLCV